MKFNVGDYQLTDNENSKPIPLKASGLKFLVFSKDAKATICAMDRLKYGERVAELSIVLRIKKTYYNTKDIETTEEFDNINVDEIIENFLSLSYLSAGKPKVFHLSKAEYAEKMKNLNNNIDALMEGKETELKPEDILGEELYNNALILTKNFADQSQKAHRESCDQIELC